MKENANTKPLLLVVNPKSGKGTAKYKLYDVISILSHKGFDVTVYPTKKQSTTSYVYENANKYERIVCCGGDGTLSEVLAGVAYSNSKVPVAQIPMGSTNDFAKNMHIPKNTLVATMIAAGNNVINYDIGSFNGRPFSYIAAVGAFTEVSYSAPQELKNTFGHFAYLLEGAKSISNIKPIKMDITMDGVQISDEFIYASVSNTYSIGGIFMLDKKAVEFDDGTFELSLIRPPKNGAEAVELISDITANRTKNKNISIYNAKNINIIFERHVVFSLDGERSEPFKEVNIRNYRQKVRLLVPKRFGETAKLNTKF